MKFNIDLHITVLAVLSVLQTVVTKGYKVTIMATPPTGPYPIDSTIDLSCFIDPTPPDPVTYKWRVLTGLYGYWEPEGQNISYTPTSDFNDFHHLWFYCRVFSNTVTTPVAEEKKVIEVHGFISPLENPVHTFATGQRVSLKVNISTKYSEARHIQSLTWYHNDSQICSCRTRNNGTELVIPNAKSSDAGIYRVKISALNLGRPDCDARILPEIEHLAMSAPVTFVLTQDHVYEYNPLDFLPRKRYFIHNTINTDSEVVVLSNEFSFHVNTTRELMEYHSETWRHEGINIDTLHPKYSSTVQSWQNLSDLLFSLEISNASADDLGDYIGIIATDMYHLTSWCKEYEYSFLPNFLFDIPIAISYSSLELYSPPLISISSSLEAANSGETVCIICSAAEGSPDRHNLTLFKNNTLLMVSTNTNFLNYSTKDAFGTYTCLVQSLYTTATKSLLLQEKANFQMFIYIRVTSTHCKLFLNHSKIANRINETIQQLCNCSATAQLIYTHCLSTELLMLEGTLSYSDESGNMTATTVVDILQESIQSTNYASIIIDGNVLELSNVYPSRKNRLMNSYCHDQAFPVESSYSSKQATGYLCDSFLQGVVAGLLLSVLAILLLIRFGVLKLKNEHTPSKEKNEMVAMGNSFSTSKNYSLLS